MSMKPQGRPATEHSARLNIHISPELLERLRERARAEHRSLSAEVRLMLERALSSSEAA